MNIPSHHDSTVRTVRAVLAGLKAGAPMTDTAHTAMPAYIDTVRGLGETALADDLAAAYAARA